MPLVPMLTVDDNADGSGGLAVVAGSSPGSTNTISVNRDGSTAWTVAGNCQGDGAVALALAKGYYWVKCDSLLAGQSVVSIPARLPVTDDDDSVHLRAARAVQARFQALAMPLLAGGVQLHLLPDENATSFPCVIGHFNEGEQIANLGSNRRDDVGYPVHWLLCERKLTALSDVPEWAFSYRQRMMRNVRKIGQDGGLAGVPEIYNALTVPMLVVDEKLPSYDFFVTGFTAICVSREGRV
jgi:hypothetical protein